MSTSPSDRPSDREIELLQRIKALERALRTTLDYQSELQPNVPTNIAAFYPLLGDPNSAMDVNLDVIADFLDTVTSMARFLSSTAAMEVFSRSGTSGFVDWIILSTIASQPRGSFTDRQLARFIGASPKRTRRRLDALADSGMVSLSTRKDADLFDIEITSAGQVSLAAVNADLELLLEFFAKRDPLQSLVLASRIRLLSRLHDRAFHRGRAGKDD